MMPTEPIAVVCPSLGRPDRLGPLIGSLGATTTKATLYVVVDPPDAERVRHLADRRVRIVVADVDVPRGVAYRRSSFAQKANAALPHLADEPFVALVGEDVDFHPGWWGRAHACFAQMPSVALVSTHDGGLNPHVGTGRIAVHPIMRRSWIDREGASWDGPGTVCHDGYRHTFVDHEWTAKAFQDRAYWFEPRSTIAHDRHVSRRPARFGVTAEAIRQHAVADQALFKARLDRFWPDLDHPG